MRPAAPRLQPLVRARIADLGPAGAAWQAELPGLLADLAAEWSLRLGRALPGGSASYVVRAVTAEGLPRVLKVALPDSDLSDQARTLAAAEGRGYALLHAHDPVRRAILLEDLGPSLDRTPLPVEAKLEALADTLLAAWTLPLDTAPALTVGQDKASTLHALVTGTAARIGCPGPVLRQALHYAERRAATYDAGDPGLVVVHGDAHPANVLRVERPRPGADSGWVFVDPDGFRCDPAYDAGVVLRDWSGRLLTAGSGGAARALLEGWCALLAARTGLPEQRVWEWAFLERVSTGLYVSSFGGGRIGHDLLASATLLLD